MQADCLPRSLTTRLPLKNGGWKRSRQAFPVIFSGANCSTLEGHYFQMGWNDQKQAKKKTVSPEVFHAQKNKQPRKTHTVHGDWQSQDQRGLLPRIAEGTFTCQIWRSEKKCLEKMAILPYSNIYLISHKLWKWHRKMHVIFQYFTCLFSNPWYLMPSCLDMLVEWHPVANLRLTSDTWLLDHVISLRWDGWSKNIEVKVLS